MLSPCYNTIIMFIMCCHHHIVSTFLQSKIVFLDFEYVSMHFNRRNISLHYVVWAGLLQIKGWMWSELTECECGAAWAPQHSMLPESRVTWPWPGPSSPQSSYILAQTSCKLLLLISLTFTQSSYSYSLTHLSYSYSELYPMYILAQTSCSSYSSVPKLKVLEGYSAKYS